MTKPPNPRRRKAHYNGVEAETLVRKQLEEAGFSTLKQRYKCPGGEIDLIVSKHDLICFVEVKARPSLNEGLESITKKAQERQRHAAQHWLHHRFDHCVDHAGLSSSSTLSCRFDVAIVTPDQTVTLIEDAFQ